MGENGLIFDIKRFAIHDGPGIRTTVFFKGCLLRCAWCHNPESQDCAREIIFRRARCIRCGACLDACKASAISWGADGPVIAEARCARCGACVEVCFAEARELVGREMTVAELVSEVERDLPFYEVSGGGVTCSGGEPLLQLEFLAEFLAACRGRGIHAALDTCGYAPREVLESIRPNVDLFLYDLKLIDDARHCRFTSSSNRLILGNLVWLSGTGAAIIVRVPVIPGVNDDEEEVRRIAAFIAGLPRVPEVHLLPYHRAFIDKYERLNRVYQLGDVPAPSLEILGAVAHYMREAGLTVRIGG